MITLKAILDKLNPMTTARLQRKAWVDSLVLPPLTDGSCGLRDKPITIHPKLDDYMTFNERLDLLLRSGWVVAYPKDGKVYYYGPKNYEILIAVERLIDKGLLNGVDQQLKLYITGENYNA